MCVNLQSGPQRIIGFGQTAPNLLKDTASILDSPLLLWKISSSLPKVWKQQQQNWRQQLTTWAAAHQSLCCLLSNSCCLRESHGERRGNIQVFFRVCPSVKVIRFQLFSKEKHLLLILCSWSQEAFLIPIHLDLIPTTKWGPDRHPPNSIRSHRTIFH